MRWPFKSRSRKTVPAAPMRQEGGSSSQASPETDADVVARLAAEHLPDSVRHRWEGLLRRAVHLVPVEGGSATVARLGGLPDLPADEAWPTWPGHGPLSYIGEVFCDRLAEFPLDLPIPTRGRMLFFYFDGSYDNFAATVGTWDPSSLQGARALHVPAGVTCSPRPTPEGIDSYQERWYAGRSILTAPGPEHPDLRDAFMALGEDDRSFMEHPVNADEFVEALHERHVSPLHQVGGYADPVQGPVEHEVAQAAVGNAVPYGDPRLEDEAGRWELLFQIDSDDDLGMMWGDCGVLYWMARPEDLTIGNLRDVSFAWQCS